MNENLMKKLHGRTKVDIASFTNLTGEVNSTISFQLNNFSNAVTQLHQGIFPLNTL